MEWSQKLIITVTWWKNGILLKFLSKKNYPSIWSNLNHSNELSIYPINDAQFIQPTDPHPPSYLVILNLSAQPSIHPTNIPTINQLSDPQSIRLINQPSIQQTDFQYIQLTDLLSIQPATHQPSWGPSKHLCDLPTDPQPIRPSNNHFNPIDPRSIQPPTNAQPFQLTLNPAIRLSIQ